MYLLCHIKITITLKTLKIMTTHNVTVSKEQFELDLTTCLTLLERKSENTFLCEYKTSNRTLLVLVTTY